jgi:hypothetical protein
MDKVLAYRRDVDRRDVHRREAANRLETRQRLVRHRILRCQEAAICAVMAAMGATDAAGNGDEGALQ